MRSSIVYLLGYCSTAFRDKRCLWTHLSIPLNRSSRGCYVILENAWFSWYQWCPRFPKLWVSANTSISQKRFNLVTKLNSNELWFGPLFRIAGYGLLGLHYSTLLIFLSHRFATCLGISNFNKSGWACACTLLGLVLVLSGRKRIFKFLSWASLVGCCLCCYASRRQFRLIYQNNQQLSSQLNQQTTQMKQLRNLLSKATTSEELSSILARLNPPRPCARD